MRSAEAHKGSALAGIEHTFHTACLVAPRIRVFYAGGDREGGVLSEVGSLSAWSRRQTRWSRGSNALMTRSRKGVGEGALWALFHLTAAIRGHSPMWTPPLRRVHGRGPGLSHGSEFVTIHPSRGRAAYGNLPYGRT